MPNFNLPPFQPVGTASLIAANSTAPAGVRLAGDPTNETLGWRQYRIMNNGAQTAFYATGADATAAQNAAVIPTNATVGGAHPLPAGAVEVISLKTGLYWSAITATNTGASVFITPGTGI
jgi:hypothetical protein